MRCSLFALPIFGICLVIQLSNSHIICNKNYYTVVYSNGTFKRCLSCGKCHEGYGLYPPCGSKLFHPPISECRSCKAQTFSSEYDSSSCKACHQCAEYEIKEAECTNKSDTACSGKCKQGYFMSKTVHNCQECSACCSDGRDEKIKECVGLGIKNKECSPRPDKTCAGQRTTTADTGQRPTTAATKGSEGLPKKYLITIIVFSIVVPILVVITIVMVCRRQKRKKAKEKNGSASIASQDYATDVGPQTQQLQQLQVTVPVITAHSALNPMYQRTPPQHSKNNPKPTAASQDYATDLGPQTQQSQMTVPVIAHSASNPTYQATPTPQPKNNPKPTAVGAVGRTPSQGVAAKETQKPKDSNSNVKKPSVSRQGSQDSQTSGEARKRSLSLRSTTEVFSKSSYKKDDFLIESEEGVEAHEPIKIIKHPKSQTVKEGSKVQLECKLEKKSQHFLYQWYRDDGSAMLGQNDTVLVLDPVELQHFGSYLCRVSFKDSFTEYKESNFAELDVNPTPGRNGMRPRCLSEVDFSTMDCVASLLGSQRDWRGIGSKYGMAGYKIDALANATPDERGRGVLEFLKTSKPKLTVYDFCKTLKEETFKRFDIVKELENHFLVST